MRSSLIDGLKCGAASGIGLRPNRGTRRSAGVRLSLLLGFSGDWGFHRGVWTGVAWRGGNDVGNGISGFGKQGVGRVDQGSDQVRGREGRGLQGFVVIEHPSGEQGLRCFLNPLIDESGDFVSQIGRVIESGQLKALQGGTRSSLQIIERRGESCHGHGLRSNLSIGLVQKGRPLKVIT
jgi:hypothetical protein